MANVKVNLDGLKQFSAALSANLAATENGPIRRAMRQWAVRYRGFVQQRFVTNSRGGGDWPGLSLATIYARRTGRGAKAKTRGVETTRLMRQVASLRGRKAKALGKRDYAKVRKIGLQITKAKARISGLMTGVAILRDTGTLFLALTPTWSAKPGALEQHIPMGVRVGYGGPQRHAKGGGATIADIASFHQTGAGHLPVRRIIVDPTPQLVDAMRDDMERALRKMVGDANRGAA